MRPVISDQTMFKFGDRVIIKYGFYRGMAGKVQNYFEKSNGPFKSHSKEYLINSDVGNLEILVEENQIEIVGHK